MLYADKINKIVYSGLFAMLFVLQSVALVACIAGK